MKKIILALDGLRLSESAMDYAIFISKEFDAYIVAAFLEEAAYFSQPVGHDIWWPYYGTSEAHRIFAISKKDEATRNESVKKLQAKFESEGVHFSIHKDRYLALHSLLMESHFADMIIIDAEASFSNFDKTKPSHFIRNLLSEASCPIMLVPKKFKPVERFVFAFDGSPSSAYAIRLFTYLFPNVPKQELEIVTVTDKKKHQPSSASGTAERTVETEVQNHVTVCIKNKKYRRALT